MAAVSAPHGGDTSGMARGRQPVVNRGPNSSTLDRRIARAMMTGDQEHDPVAARNRLIKPAVDRDPRSVEVHAMQVEHAIWLDRAAAKLFVPTAVERLVRDWGSGASDWDRFRRPRSHYNSLRPLRKRCRLSLARERPDGERNARPQLRLLRVEGAHARPSPSGPKPALRRSQTCRPRSRPHLARRPRMCRSGSRL